MPGCLLRLLESFLTGRTQQVLINDQKSNAYKTVSGVPQGSCIGPLLFLVYINDIFDDVPKKVQCSLYADDSKLSVINDPDTFQIALNKVFEWSQLWKLSLCKRKCVVLNINPKRTLRVFTMDQQPLINSKTVTDLGLIYTNSLSFRPYIDTVVNKARGRSNYVLRAFISTNPFLLFKVFKVYVRPILEYATEIWNPTNTKYIKKIESIQKRFTYRIFKRTSLPYLNYTNRLKILKTSSLESRRNNTDLITTFKIFHNKINVPPNAIFERSMIIGRSRRHKFTIRPFLHKKERFS